jgi:hypothetical protein
MEDFEPITTIEQAKVYFCAMGCSHFHMAREYPERYREYQKLKISRETEHEWRSEQFDTYYASIMENTAAEDLWAVHSRMYDLFAELRTHPALVKMLEVTRHIRDRVPLYQKIIVAETINGRRDRGGLIYPAFDAHDTAMAKEFIELSLHFSDPTDLVYRERCENAIALCREIQRELGL